MRAQSLFQLSFPASHRMIFWGMLEERGLSVEALVELISMFVMNHFTIPSKKQ
jgi:hypothetical protein